MLIQGKTSYLHQDLNVTPLMDVMLVLLVIFMMVTPLIQTGREFLYPTAVEFASLEQKNQLIGRLDRIGGL